jgi:hypothetical protein
MAHLTRRLQILLDHARYEQLEHRARQQRTSVAALVREAIDTAFPEDWPDRNVAGARILGAEPMSVDDWPAMKAEILGGLYDRAVE